MKYPLKSRLDHNEKRWDRKMYEESNMNKYTYRNKHQQT